MPPATLFYEQQEEAFEILKDLGSPVLTVGDSTCMVIVGVLNPIMSLYLRKKLEGCVIGREGRIPYFGFALIPPGIHKAIIAKHFGGTV